MRSRYSLKEWSIPCSSYDAISKKLPRSISCLTEQAQRLRKAAQGTPPGINANGLFDEPGSPRQPRK